jgi:hypothetical protein
MGHATSGVILSTVRLAADLGYRPIVGIGWKYLVRASVPEQIASPTSTPWWSCNAGPMALICKVLFLSIDSLVSR